jgi:hypothetical protein
MDFLKVLSFNKMSIKFINSLLLVGQTLSYLAPFVSPDIFWPIASIFANIFIIYVGITSGHSTMLIYWWIIFTVLDVTASLYCVSVTKEKISLVFYSLYYRIFFINVVYIAKVLATFEEFFGVKMSWGKLERKGRI